MKIEEYAPLVTPTSSAKAKFLSVSPPKKYSANNVMSTVASVLTDRVMVCSSDVFTISS